MRPPWAVLLLALLVSSLADRAPGAAQSTDAAQATQVADSGLLQRLPDTQQRGVPPNVPWAATAAVLLGTSVALAALKRPPSTA